MGIFFSALLKGSLTHTEEKCQKRGMLIFYIAIWQYDNMQPSCMVDSPSRLTKDERVQTDTVSVDTVT